jgi:hypothetical protein
MQNQPLCERTPGVQTDVPNSPAEQLSVLLLTRRFQFLLLISLPSPISTPMSFITRASISTNQLFKCGILEIRRKPTIKELHYEDRFNPAPA